jgi:hypothetical protein
VTPEQTADDRTITEHADSNVCPACKRPRMEHKHTCDLKRLARQMTERGGKS